MAMKKKNSPMRGDRLPHPPGRLCLIKFLSPGTAKVPNAQEGNIEASIRLINWIISNVSKSPNSCKTFLAGYTTYILFHWYGLYLILLKLNNIRDLCNGQSRRKPSFFPNFRTFFLRRKFNYQHVTVRSCRPSRAMAKEKERLYGLKTSRLALLTSVYHFRMPSFSLLSSLVKIKYSRTFPFSYETF